MVNGVSNSNITQAIMANPKLRNIQKNYFNQVLKENQKDSLNKENQQVSKIDNTGINESKKVKDPISEKNKEYIEKVKEYASVYGNNLTEHDINYAMRYGRSVLVDKRA